MLFARPLALFVLILVALVAAPAEAATVIVKYRRGVASVFRTTHCSPGHDKAMLEPYLPRLILKSM